MWMRSCSSNRLPLWTSSSCVRLLLCRASVWRTSSAGASGRIDWPQSDGTPQALLPRSRGEHEDRGVDLINVIRARLHSYGACAGVFPSPPPPPPDILYSTTSSCAPRSKTVPANTYVRCVHRNHARHVASASSYACLQRSSNEGRRPACSSLPLPPPPPRPPRFLRLPRRVRLSSITGGKMNRWGIDQRTHTQADGWLIEQRKESDGRWSRGYSCSQAVRESKSASEEQE